MEFRFSNSTALAVDGDHRHIITSVDLLHSDGRWHPAFQVFEGEDECIYVQPVYPDRQRHTQLVQETVWGRPIRRWGRKPPLTDSQLVELTERIELAYIASLDCQPSAASLH